MLYGKIIITRRDTYSSFKAPCKRWDAALQRCFYKKVFWNYAANLQENTHIEVWFQQSCKFAGYFHNVFSYEHLWRAASGAIHLTVKYQIETMTNVTNSSWRTFTFNEVRVLTKNSISKYRGTLHVLFHPGEFAHVSGQVYVSVYMYNRGEISPLPLFRPCLRHDFNV